MDDFDNLVSGFAQLEATTITDEPYLSAIPVPGRPSDHLACTARGTPCFLIDCDEAVEHATIELKYITATFSVQCTVESVRGEVTRGKYVMVEFHEGSPELQDYFIRVVAAGVQSLPEEPSASAASSLVTRLAQLFMMVDEPSSGTILGLWAELFVIAASGEPATMFGAWRETTSDPFDFNAPPQCLEVKATISEHRTHHFSLRQVVAAGDTTEIAIASLLLRSSHAGTTVRDLMNRIRLRAGLDASGWLSLEERVATTLGQQWRDALDVAFDEGYARERLGLYRADDVPQVTGDLPPGVSDVRFTSDLAYCTMVNPSDFSRGFLQYLPSPGGSARTAG